MYKYVYILYIRIETRRVCMNLELVFHTSTQKFSQFEIVEFN